MNSMIKFNNRFGSSNSFQPNHPHMDIEQILINSCSKRIDCWICFEQEFRETCSIFMWGWFGWNEFDDQIQQSIRFEQEFDETCSISMWGWFGWNEFDDQIQQSIRIIEFISTKSSSHEYWTSLTKLLFKTNWLLNLFWTRVSWDLFNIHVRMIWLKWIRWSNSTIDSFWTRVWWNLFNIHVRMIWLKWIRWSNSTIDSDHRIHFNQIILTWILNKSHETLVQNELIVEFVLNKSLLRLVQYPCEDDLVEMNSMIKFNNQFVLNKSLVQNESIVEFFWTRVCLDLFNIHVRMIWLKWIRWSNSTIDSFWTRVWWNLFNIYVRMIWLKWIRWSNSTIDSFWTRVCVRLVQYPC